MKKMLFTFMLVCAFSILPIKSMAMLRVNEDGNPIEKEVKEGEVSTMMSPDEAISSDGQSTSSGVNPNKTGIGQDSIEPSPADDGQAGNSGEVIYPTTSRDDQTTTGVDGENAVEEDLIYKTVSDEKMETTKTNDSGDRLIAATTMTGISGLVLGSVGAWLILSRKK